MTRAVEENWKEVQETTFTNWVNNSLRGHLKKSERHVDDLKEGLKDGLTLIQLLETVGKAKVGKYNHNPKIKAQMMENLEACFKFMEREKIKTVNIGPVDIYNGEIKLILGLVWTLIRRFQIRSTGRDLSTKAAMLAWINTQIPDQNIKNFTTDWNDGVALCALVDRVKPGVCPQYGTLSRTTKLENCALGMNLAEDKLKIPRIMEPEHLSHPDIDELSVMTYVSYFCKPANDHLLRWVQEKLPDRNITDFQKDWNDGINLACLIEALCPGTFPNCRDLDPHNSLENLAHAMKVGEDHLGVKPVIKPSQMANPSVDELNVVTYLSRFQYAKPIPQPHEVTCSGNGLYKAFVGRPATFEVDATRGGVGELKVTAISRNSSPFEAEIKPLKRAGFFEARYIPKLPGKLELEVKWSGYAIPASPFHVDVLDVEALKITGKQITGGQCAKAGKVVQMEVEGLMDVADLYILIQHADGHTETAKVIYKGSGIAHCSYTPLRVGIDEVFAKIAGTDLPGSPFQVKVVDPHQCSASQHDPPPGLPVSINQKVTVAIVASGVNANGIVAEIKSPAGVQELPIVKSAEGPNLATFTPVKVGKHQVMVTCAGENVRGSPVLIDVGDPMKCAFLDTFPRYLQVNKVHKVNLSSKGAGPGEVSVQSSQTGIVKAQTKKGVESELYTVELAPTVVGESTITVEFNGQPIPPTPHNVFVCDASHCSAYSPGLTSGKGKIEELFNFTVQVKDAGRGELTVKPKGPKSVYAADIKRNSDDTYNVSFTSFETGMHEIDILWGGEHIPNSPYSVDFSRGVDMSKISVRGSGLEGAIANRRAELTVYARESKLFERGALNLGFKSASGAKTENPEYEICDNDNGSYSISYTPKVAGLLTLSVSGEGKEVAGGPFKITVRPEPNASMCTVLSRGGDDIFKGGSECYHLIRKPLELAVDTTKGGTGSLTSSGKQPDGTTLRVFATEEKQGLKSVTWLKLEPTVLGTHELSVLWDGQDIARSPFKIHAINPESCKPTGEFARYVKVDESKSVAFTTIDCGPGKLEARSLDTQLSTEIKGRNVNLTGIRLGMAKVHVTFGTYEIPGSPFTVGVCDPSKCSLDFSTVKNQNYVVGQPFNITVNAVNAGTAKLLVQPMDNSHKYNIEVKNVRNGTWSIICTPWTTGEQGLTVLWGDWPINGSPLKFSVSDPKKVVVKGLPDPQNYIPVIGEPIVFTVDYTEAGFGNLTTQAKLEDGELTEIEREETDSDSRVASLQLVPKKPGKLELILKFNGVDILPAVCIYEVPDPSRFQVTPPKGFGRMKEYVKFPVTGISKDTDLKISAIHTNHDATVKTEPGKDENTVIARFTPKHTGEYKVEVKHKGQDIAGSPFTVQIANPDACKPVADLPSVIHVGDKAEFEIDSSDCGPGEIGFRIEPISGGVQPNITSENTKHTMWIEEGIGACKLTVTWADYAIPSSPFLVHFVDSSQVEWSCNRELDIMKQGEVLLLTLDCTKAGQATPEVRALGPQSEFPSQQKDMKDGTFTETLNPWQVGENSIDILYGGHAIPNSPIKFEVVKPVEARAITASGDALIGVIANVPANVTITTPDPGLLDRGVLKAKFLSQEDVSLPAIELTDVGDGTYDLTLLSEIEGEFSLDISCDDQSIVGSPFKIFVSAAPRADKCFAFGPALEKSPRLVVDDPVKFTVDSTNAGTGNLAVSAKQPNGESIQVYQNHERGEKILHHLKFDPEISGSHVVTITWEGSDIPGSPFQLNVTDPTKVRVEGLPLVPHGLAYINEPISFKVNMKDSGTSTPVVYVDPPDKQDPIVLTGDNVSEDTLSYSYTPTSFGNYLISIECGRVDVNGSPFKVNVVDPSKFSIAALSLKGDYALVCEQVSIYIHGNASDGETILVTAHGPTADLNVETSDIGEGKYQANFVPIEPGCYEVFVEYAGAHVNGSPFTVNVADPSKCQVLGDVPEIVQVGKSEEFTVKTRGAGIGELKAVISDKSKSSVSTEIVNEGLDTYSVVLHGEEIDELSLELQWAGFNIPQSPFPIKVCDASKCKAYGQAIVSKKGSAGEPINFSVLTKNAGKGKLSIVAKGPSAQYTVDVKEIQEDTHEVAFTPWEVGTHSVEVKWGNSDIPDSPFTIEVGNPMDSTVCNATGEGLKNAIAGQEAYFMIISSEAGLLEKNALKVSVLGIQSHAELVVTDNNNGSYNVTYTAPTPGAYVASVSFYDRQIPGSPFKVNVFPSPDASKCFAYGPALNKNSILMAGSPLELFVDTSEGGHGQLRVYIQGPNDYRPKVFMASDDKGVYSIKFDAMKAGKYFVVVAWSEEHIPGSPFKLKVFPAADAGKVKAYGPGLIDGFLGSPGQFTVETRNAGVGTLLIRVHGLKDSFQIEANPISKEDPRTLIAAYNPKLKGNYVVFVRWSGTHVPGSPFTINIRPKPGSAGSGSSDEVKPKPKQRPVSKDEGEITKLDEINVDESFARALPQYDTPAKRKKGGAKKDKKRKSRPMSSGSGQVMVSSFSSATSSNVGPIGPSLKMKANPGMAMAMATTGDPDYRMAEAGEPKPMGKRGSQIQRKPSKEGPSPQHKPRPFSQERKPTPKKETPEAKPGKPRTAKSPPPGAKIFRAKSPQPKSKGPKAEPPAPTSKVPAHAKEGKPKPSTSPAKSASPTPKVISPSKDKNPPSKATSPPPKVASPPPKAKSPPPKGKGKVVVSTSPPPKGAIRARSPPPKGKAQAKPRGDKPKSGVSRI